MIEMPVENKPTYTNPNCHIIAGQTLENNIGVSRRIVVRDRAFSYIASTNSAPNGLYRFEQLPAQTLANPYMVMCFDDSSAKRNAMIYDYVYSVDNSGIPPQS